MADKVKHLEDLLANSATRESEKRQMTERALSQAKENTTSGDAISLFQSQLDLLSDKFSQTGYDVQQLAAKVEKCLTLEPSLAGLATQLTEQAKQIAKGKTDQSKSLSELEATFTDIIEEL